MISFLVKNRRSFPIPNPRVETDFAFWTDEHGTVSIAAPQGHAPFQCNIGAPDYQTKEIRIDPNTPPTTVFLDYAHRLRGKVLDEAGRPLSGVLVAADGTPLPSDYGTALGERIGKRVRSHGRTQTDSDGMFSLPLPFPPAIAVIARKPGYKTEFKQFEEGKLQTWVEIHMSPAEAGIFGRVTDESGNPVQRFRIVIYGTGYLPGHAQNFDTEDGGFLIPDLPDGTYSIRASSPLIPDREFRIDRLTLRNRFFYGPIVVPLTITKAIIKK